MALRVLVGSANGGKTGVLHGRIRDGVVGGRTGALLLPSAPDVSRAVSELANTVPIGLTVTTFDSFLDRLWAEAEPNARIVSSTQRMLLLADIVSSVTLHELGLSARAPGFLGALAAFVERSSGSQPLVGSIRTAGGPGAEILQLLSEYDRRLRSNGLVERVDAHGRLADLMARLPLPDIVAVNRFTGFTIAQEAFLIALAPRCEALVSLTYDPGTPATFAAAGQLERLSAAGVVETVSSARPHSTSAELVRIERSLGRTDAGVPEAGGAVVLSEAWGATAEAGRIVREVQDALDAGIPAGSVAIAFRDPLRHLRALRGALDDAEIDADWDLRVSFGMTRLGRALILLLGYLGGTRSARELLDVLRSPFCPAASDAIDELDVRLRAARQGVDRGTFERMLKSADSAAGAFVTGAREAARTLGAPESERLWWDVVAAMMGSARAGAPILDVDGLIDVAAQRTFLAAVAELARAEGAKVAPGDLVTALRSASVAVASPGRPDRVQIMSVERLRGRRYRCVILGGLTMGEFPRQARDGAFSSPAIRAELARAGVAAPERATLDEERLMFYQAVTRASDRLVLSRQSHDADGRALRPSVFLEELLDLYRDPASGELGENTPPRHVLGLDESQSSDGAPRSTRRILRSALASGHTDEAPESERDRLAHVQYRTRPRSGCLGPEARATLASRQTFSVSDIEAYLQCPFRWYVERVLRPAEIDVEVDAAASGRLAHEILRDVYEEFVSRTGHVRIDPSDLAHALEIHAEVAEVAVSRIRTASASEGAAVRAVVRNTARLLASDVDFLPGFAPTYREWSFGLGEADQPEVFGDFALVGRVDRIDVDMHGHLVVSDYKSGKVASDRARKAFAANGLVQLPLYAAVAHRRLGLEPVGGLYRGIGGGRPRGFVRDDVTTETASFVGTDIVDAEEIQALIADAIARSAEAVAGMRAGEIPKTPPAQGCPGYCAARALCEKRGVRRAYTR